MNYQSIPQELKDINRWLCWKYIPNKDPSRKPRKAPVDINTGRLADNTDPAYHNTFDAATAAASLYDGIGFAFSPDDDIVGIDLDKMSAYTEEQIETIGKIVNSAKRSKCYIESTPSGDGLHIMLRGILPGAIKTDQIEAYTEGRYFTFTGNGSGDIVHDQDIIDSLEQFRENSSTNHTNHTNHTNLNKPLPSFVQSKNSGILESQQDQFDIVRFLDALSHFPAPAENDGRYVLANAVAKAMFTHPEHFIVIETAYNEYCEMNVVEGGDDHEYGDKLERAVKETESGKNNTPYQYVFKMAHDAGWAHTEPAPTSHVNVDVGESTIPSLHTLQLNMTEMTTARITPTTIIPNYLYADVAALIATGGVGKTTLILHELICMALGRPVWGKRFMGARKSLFITAEDAREQLVARMYKMMQGMELNDSEMAQVMTNVMIWDVTGGTVKLIQMNKMIELTTLSDNIVDHFKDAGVSLVVFDPLISFGAAESAVNDNSQGLITAARRVSKGLDCCVRYIHHMSKEGAANGDTSAHAGRGGTALGDGSRMVNVLTPIKFDVMSPELSDSVPPDVLNGWLEAGVSTVMRLSQPKLSFCPPQPDVIIARAGYKFFFHDSPPLSVDERDLLRDDRILKWLSDDLKKGIQWSKTAARDSTIPSKLGMVKASFMEAVETMLNDGRLDESDLPEHLRRGAKKKYLRPVNYSVI